MRCRSTSTTAPAIFEGSDISGVAQSVAQQREILSAWMPEMQKVMREKFGSMIVSTFAFPQQVFFCRDEISSLADIKGQEVRVQGVSQSDLVKALGGAAVTIPFGEVVPALEKGVVDCGITGTLPGYQAKWPEVVKTRRRRVAGLHCGLRLHKPGQLEQALPSRPRSS
jgi:TRAP-type C4-dicarboxylate transport system substrate-binding protein